ELVPAELLHRRLHPRLELLVGLLGARDADDRELLGQKPAEGQRVERGEELLLRQVAGRAEDDHGARVRRAPKLQPLEERILGDRRHAREGTILRPRAFVKPHACASSPRFARMPSRSSAKESENFSTPSRSSVSTTES